MPLLNIPNTFTKFTTIYSGEVNANFAAISTLLNTTRLDDANIQDAGITLPTKVKATGATSGQVLSFNGTAVVWAASSLGLLFDRIVGSAAQVTAGQATDSTIAAAITAAPSGGRILLLPSYTGTENITIDKKLFIFGMGHASVITGTVTFTANADYSTLLNVRVTQNITLNTGADGIIVNNVFLAATRTFVDNGSGNLLTAIQE